MGQAARAAGHGLAAAIPPGDRPTADRVGPRIGGGQAQRVGRALVHARRPAQRQRRRHVQHFDAQAVAGECPVFIRRRRADGVIVGPVGIHVRHAGRVAAHQFRRAVAPVDQPGTDRVRTRITRRQVQRVSRAFIRAGRPADHQRRRHVVHRHRHAVRGERPVFIGRCRADRVIVRPVGIHVRHAGRVARHQLRRAVAPVDQPGCDRVRPRIARRQVQRVSRAFVHAGRPADHQRRRHVVHRHRHAVRGERPVFIGRCRADGVIVRPVGIHVRHAGRVAAHQLRRAVAPIDQPGRNRVRARISGRQVQSIGRTFVHAGRPADHQRGGDIVHGDNCYVGVDPPVIIRDGEGQRVGSLIIRNETEVFIGPVGEHLPIVGRHRPQERMRVVAAGIREAAVQRDHGTFVDSLVCARVRRWGNVVDGVRDAPDGGAGVVVGQSYVDRVNIGSRGGRIVIEILVGHVKAGGAGREAEGFRCAFAPINNQRERVLSANVADVAGEMNRSIFVDHRSHGEVGQGWGDVIDRGGSCG